MEQDRNACYKALVASRKLSVTAETRDKEIPKLWVACWSHAGDAAWLLAFERPAAGEFGIKMKTSLWAVAGA